MVRLLFLILVVFGALAVTLAVVLGISVAKVAKVHEPVPPAAVEPSTPSAGPGPAATVASTQPSNVDRSSAPPDRAAVVVPAPVEPPAAPAGQRIVEAPAVIPPAEFVPGTIVLRAANAKIHGKVLRKAPPSGDLTNWSRPEDFVTWSFYPPRGKYRVLVTRATGGGAGGDFALALSESKKADFLFLSKAAPTGGWETFRTEFVGILDLDEKRTTLQLRPAGDITSALMRLRQVELVPVSPLVAADPDKGQDGDPAVAGITIVEAASGKPLGLLTNSMVLDVSSLPPFSLRAETTGKVGSVRFNLNKADVATESQRPFSIAGERGQGYIPWNVQPGKHTLTLTPFTEPGANGRAGNRHTLTFTLLSAAPVVLNAADATRHGDGIRVAPGAEPTLTGWSREQDWIEWMANVPVNGEYHVEVLYSVAKGQGGEFMLRVGDQKVTEKVSDTGGWEAYNRKTLGPIRVSKGKVRVAIKPADLDDGKALMNLREVRLAPVVIENDD